MRICDDLRQAVLQAAIQGQLTKQLPEDGNAEEQINNIFDKKESYLWEKGKKKVVLRLITEKDLNLDIPNNWSVIRLGRVVSILGRIGFRGFTKSDFTDKTGAISLSPGNLLPSNKMTYEACSYIKWEKYNESPEIKIKNGDLLLVKTGSSYGKCAVVENLPKEATINPQLARVVSHGVNISFLRFVFSSPFAKSQFDSFVTGTATPTFSQEKIANFVLPFPPLAEQKRIVARVEELMARIDDLEKTETELEKLKAAFPGDMKAALLQAAMQGKLTEQLPEDGDAGDLLEQIRSEQEKLVKNKKLNKDVLDSTIDDEPPFDIPDNWGWICLKGLVCRDIRRGKSPKYGSGKSFAFAQKCNSKYDGIRLDLALSVTDAFADRFTNGEEVQDGDIVINSTGNGTLGRIGYFENKFNPNGYKYYPDSHVTTVRCLLVDSKYILYVLKCYQEYLEGKGEGSTNQKELKPDTIKRLMIPLPPLAEQKRIVEKLDKLLPLCDGLIEK